MTALGDLELGGDALLVPARPEHWPEVRALLLSRGLPLDGAEEHLAHFAVVVDRGVVVGTAGLEVHGAVGLLRSVAVQPLAVGKGVGARLTVAMVQKARSLQLREIYLLTTTAADFFVRHGFEPISRDALPAALARSRELQRACPATAIAMRLKLPMGDEGPAARIQVEVDT